MKGEKRKNCWDDLVFRPNRGDRDEGEKLAHRQLWFQKRKRNVSFVKNPPS